jgi:hypothetical protein
MIISRYWKLRQLSVVIDRCAFLAETAQRYPAAGNIADSLPVSAKHQRR